MVRSDHDACALAVDFVENVPAFRLMELTASGLLRPRLRVSARLGLITRSAVKQFAGCLWEP